MDVARLRGQIPVCQAMFYMNTGWSGPSPVPVVDAIKSRLDYEMNAGPTTPEVHQQAIEIQTKAREAVAGLLNAAPDEVCLTRNTTEGLNLVMNGLKWHPGDEIITCDLEHSSVLVPSYFQQLRHQASVKVVKIEPDQDRQGILHKIEAAMTDRTRLVFLSHIEYSSGLRMPAKQIRELAAQRGALVLLDGAQTAGHIKLDMRDLDCDFYSIPGQKWLLGAEGIGALYIKKELIPSVDPVHVAGRAVTSTEDPYNFQPVPATIDKFLLSSTSAPLQAGLLEAIRFIQGIGVEAIEARNVELATGLKQALQETPGVRLISPMDPQVSSGLVSFAIDGNDPVDVVARLWSRHKIVVRPVAYPAGVRVSLHFFNTEEEVDQLVAAVRQLADAS